MKNSLIRKILLLVNSITITSLLMFIVISVTYDSLYKQTIQKEDTRIAISWTSSIDNRLNTLYEHLYDLSSSVFNNSEVSSGSPEMDYDTRNKLIDQMNAKVMASGDITAIYILDTDTSRFLYLSDVSVPGQLTNLLKTDIQQYCLENYSSIGNKQWEVTDLMNVELFVKSIRLGKYIIGIASRLDRYGIDLPYDDYRYELASTFICTEDRDYSVVGDSSLTRYIDRSKKTAYFNDRYVLIPTSLKYVDAQTLFITRIDGVLSSGNIALIFMVIDSAVSVLLTLTLIYNVNHRVKEPIGELVNANKKLAEGDFEYRTDVSRAGSDEFAELYRSYNDMSDKIRHLTIEQYDAEIRRQQNQLKMLRAQVKPHTFLNAINTINNMTYTGKGEDIRKYISAFASFTRYMMYKAKDWTRVEDEIRNIESYVDMQKIRFPNSIEFTYDCPAEIMEENIPYLILFSLVENSFKHAMTLVNTMYVNIRGEYYEEEGFKGFRLIEEDNGPGFSKEALEQLITAEADDPFTKEHLGLTNVRYSLNLIYQRDDLLRIANKEEGGAHIELLIPETEIDDETAGL